MVVLVYSRHCFVWPLFQPRLPDVIEGLKAAWTFFGGIPRRVVLDNLPSAVAGHDAMRPGLACGFLEYTHHRGFLADPATPGRPRTSPRGTRDPLHPGPP